MSTNPQGNPTKPALRAVADNPLDHADVRDFVAAVVVPKIEKALREAEQATSASINAMNASARTEQLQKATLGKLETYRKEQNHHSGRIGAVAASVDAYKDHTASQLNALQKSTESQMGELRSAVAVQVSALADSVRELKDEVKKANDRSSRAETMASMPNEFEKVAIDEKRFELERARKTNDQIWAVVGKVAVPMLLGLGALVAAWLRGLL